MSKAARILVKLKMYDQATDAIRREIGMHQQIDHMPSIGRLAVVLVLVQLARGDQVAAEKAFKEWGNCCDVPEVNFLKHKIFLTICRRNLQDFMKLLSTFRCKLWKCYYKPMTTRMQMRQEQL